MSESNTSYHDFNDVVVDRLTNIFDVCQKYNRYCPFETAEEFVKEVCRWIEQKDFEHQYIDGHRVTTFKRADMTSMFHQVAMEYYQQLANDMLGCGRVVSDYIPPKSELQHEANQAKFWNLVSEYFGYSSLNNLTKYANDNIVIRWVK